MVAFSPYATATHCNVIGFMMMIAGLVVLVAGAMAMYSACYEKIWGAKLVREEKDRERFIFKNVFMYNYF